MNDTTPPLGVPAESVPRQRILRLVSLDVLRGLTVIFMILANTSGRPAYWPLHHAHWNGWTPTDLVFPTFLFVMGVSIVFSFDVRLDRGLSKSALFAQILRRTLVLFALGLIVNGFPYFPLASLRIYGVLQRIALCFLGAGTLYLWERRPNRIAILVVVALAGYWALVRFVPVPGFGVPGRDVPLLDPYANVVAYIDRLLFPGRLFNGTSDPEGLLSTLPALGTTLLGLLAGLWLRSERSPAQKAYGLLAAGSVGILLGELWAPWFPINKHMWTSSFVLLAAGWSFLALALCYWAVEIRNWKQGWTYVPILFGTNAITAYVFSELLASTLEAIKIPAGNAATSLSTFVYSSLFGWASPSFGCLMYSVAFVLVCGMPVLFLHRNKIFLKV